MVAAQISRLQVRIAECAELRQSLEPLREDASIRRSIRTYKKREQTLRDYIDILHQRLQRMLHQEKNARQLNKVLRATSGFSY